LTVGNGWVSPVDFWRLKPWEVHWILSAYRPDAVPGRPENWRDVALRNLREAKEKDKHGA